MSGFIYLPFNFFDFKKITNEFEDYIKKCKPNSLNKLKIKNHTYANSSQKHKDLIYKLEDIIDKLESVEKEVIKYRKIIYESSKK